MTYYIHKKKKTLKSPRKKQGTINYTVKFPEGYKRKKQSTRDISRYMQNNETEEVKIKQ